MEDPATTPAPSTTPECFELPPEFEALVDILEFAQYYEGTTAAIRIRKVDNSHCLFIAADSAVKHPKKLLSKANAVKSGLKFALLRGCAALGNEAIILCKLTDECDVSYKICCTNSTSDKPDLVLVNSDYQIVSGEERLSEIVKRFPFYEMKKLTKYLKRMNNDSEILVIIPMKRVGRDFPLLKSEADENSDITSKRKINYLTHSLKVYLSIAFLIPKMLIAVEGVEINNHLLVRSLCQTETVDVGPDPSTTDQEEEESKQQVRMSCGFTVAWSGAPGLICYHNGRIVHYVRDKTTRSRSMYKFVGIVHNIPRVDAPEHEDILAECVKHYMSEYAAVKSRAFRNFKMDEEWQQCVDCLKWREVNHPLDDGSHRVCSTFDMLSSCEEIEAGVLPMLGSNKRPLAAQTPKKRRSEPVKRVRAGTPVEFHSAQKPPAKKAATRKTPKHKSEERPSKLAKYFVPELDDSDSASKSLVKLELDSQDGATKSPTENGVKSPSKKPIESPAKRQGTSPRNSPSKSPAKKSTAKPSLDSLHYGSGDGSGSVLDFHMNSEPEKSPVIGRQDRVEDSLSDDSPSLQATPISYLNFGNSSERNRITHLKQDTAGSSSKTSLSGAGKLEDYYSLSDGEDDDPKTLKIKQLKSELRQASKRVEMLRQPVAQFLKMIMLDDEVVQNDASPEKLVSLLLDLTEDSEASRKYKLLNRAKSSPRKNQM